MLNYTSKEIFMAQNTSNALRFINAYNQIEQALKIQNNLKRGKKKKTLWDFPDGPVAKTLHSQCRGPRFNPWSGN